MKNIFTNPKYIFIIIMWGIFLLLTSCVTQSACNRKFPPQISDSIKTVVKDTTYWCRDTVVQAVSHDIILHLHDTIIIHTFGKNTTVTDTVWKVKTIHTTDDRTKTVNVPVVKKWWVDTLADWWSVISLIIICLLLLWSQFIKKLPF